MKSIIISIVISILVSCVPRHTYLADGKEFRDYDEYVEYVEYSINSLEPPVIIKDMYITIITQNLYSDTIYSIIVKDANNKIKYYKNSDIITSISFNHKTNDTIR